MLLLFNISPGELVVVMLLFLMFFGAKNIPEMARFLGRTSRQIKDATRDIQDEFTNTANQVQKEVKEHKKTLDQQLDLDLDD